MNRRDLMAAALALPVAGTAPVAAAVETPVMGLFRQWMDLWNMARAPGASEDTWDAATDASFLIEGEMEKIPCQTAQDFIAKVIALSSFGICDLHDEKRDPMFWAEARAFVGVAPHG